MWNKDIEREVIKYLELEQKSNQHLLYKSNRNLILSYFEFVDDWTLISTPELKTSLFASDENMYSKIGQWGDGKKKF